MPKQMVGLDLKEVSGVNAPAHLTPGWLVLKSIDPALAEVLENAAAVTVNKETQSMPEFDKEALAPEVKAEIERLEKALEEAKTATPAEPAAPADAATELTKAMESLPESVRKAFEDQAAELAKTSAVAKTLADAAETATYVEKAAGFSHLPTVTASTFGPILRDVATSVTPETYAALETVLKAADASLAEAELFGEIGSAGKAPADSALAALEGVAKSLKEADPKLSDAEAFAKATEENPALYVAHRRESDRSVKGA